jgi:hypothetical protein
VLTWRISGVQWGAQKLPMRGQDRADVVEDHEAARGVELVVEHAPGPVELHLFRLGLVEQVVEQTTHGQDLQLVAMERRRPVPVGDRNVGRAADDWPVGDHQDVAFLEPVAGRSIHGLQQADALPRLQARELRGLGRVIVRRHFSVPSKTL